MTFSTLPFPLQEQFTTWIRTEFRDNLLNTKAYPIGKRFKEHGEVI